MKSASAAFLDAATRSHRVVVACEVLRSGTVIAEPDVIAGTVTLDRTAAIRGRLDITLAGADLVPIVAGDALTPYGSELRVSRGIYDPGTDTTTMVSLGIYRIETVEVADDAGNGLTMRVSARDRSATVADARFTQPYVIAQGTNYITAITAMVLDGAPGLVVEASPTTLTTPAIVQPEGDDRWAATLTMAAAIGYEAFMGSDGQLVLRAEPSVYDAPTLTVAEGPEGVLMSARRRWTRTGGYNAVIATGESTDNATPARGEAYDLNPSSPTYYLGPYGKVPMFYRSPFIATNAQALAAATGMLARQAGASQQVSIGAIPNPVLEPGDVILVQRERLGVDASLIVDSITIPLAVAGAMTADTRAVPA